jgi:hypothetical protein|tara:strand:- start:6326 stop:6712 length:387 start_codon:yes stop_codon:yes gene_type:complete
MVNTITQQTLTEGPRNIVSKVKITGDGSGDESATILVNVSEFGVPPGSVSILRIKTMLIGFTVKLLWDADTNVDIIDLPVGEQHMDFNSYGGFYNNAGVGVTGDILFTTTGLGSGDEGTIILEMKKKA